MADRLAIVALLVALVALGLPTLVLARNRQPARRALLAITVVLLFALGELVLLRREIVLGTILCVAAATLFAAARPWTWPVLESTRSRGYQRCLTFALVVAVLGVAIGLRFWRLGDVPYGIEQDEMAWTVGAAHATYSDGYDELSVQTYSFQRDLLPVSAFQERLFFDRFGMSIGSARLENAVFSTAAVVLFFLLMLQFASRSAALIATFLLATSTLHIASSRQAHAEAHVLFWVMLSYVLFWLAVRHRSLTLSLASGVTVVIGFWTYETYNMTLAVIAASLVLFAVMDLKRWRFHAVNAALFLLPFGLIAQQEVHHARARRSFQFERFDAFRASIHGPIWQQGWDWLTYFSDNLRTLLENLFVRQSRPAFEFPMVRPDGPMVLAVALPLAAVGLLLMLRAPRRTEHVFLLLWISLQLLTVPMVLGIGWGRVILPATPALFALAGTGGAFVLEGLSRAYGRQGWLVGGATLLVAVALVGTGVRAYFYEVQDPEDRRIRREVFDVVAAQRDTQSLILLPVRTGVSTPREALLQPSGALMRFLLAKPPDLSSADRRYRYVDGTNLLQEVHDAHWDTGPVLILMPHRNQDPRLPVPPEERGVRRCYDVSAISVGKYVDMLEIPKESLLNPHCVT
jgi:hypothetical protein